MMSFLQRLKYAKKGFAMTLMIRFECPQCSQEMPLDLREFAPGNRQLCHTCQTPARMTKDSLDRFSKDMRQYFIG